MEWVRTHDLLCMRSNFLSVTHLCLAQIVKKTPYYRYMWVYTGGVVILKEGSYTICDASDDGSKVWIEGKLEIDNDGLHSVKEVFYFRYVSTHFDTKSTLRITMQAKAAVAMVLRAASSNPHWLGFVICINMCYVPRRFIIQH